MNDDYDKTKDPLYQLPSIESTEIDHTPLALRETALRTAAEVLGSGPLGSKATPSALIQLAEWLLKPYEAVPLILPQPDTGVVGELRVIPPTVDLD